MNIRTEIFVVADYFLSKIDMTNKKMQKMLYYAYSWYIVTHNNSAQNIRNVLFSNQPEAWIHGPVFPIIYEKYKIYGRELIPKVKEEISIDLDTNNFLDAIIEIFGKFDGDQLELMTHNESPWQKSRENLDNDAPSNNRIEMEEIYNYYSNL